MKATTCPASLPAVTRLAVYRRPHIAGQAVASISILFRINFSIRSNSCNSLSKKFENLHFSCIFALLDHFCSDSPLGKFKKFSTDFKI